MSPFPAATPDASLSVLVADSSRMQSQLLTTALRRHPEFRITQCSMDWPSIQHVLTVAPAQVALISLDPAHDLSESLSIVRHFHLMHPNIPKVLLADVCGRDLTIAAFRSGVRGIFCLTDANLRLLYKCIHCVGDGQVWANTEQLSDLLDLVSEVPSLRVFSSNGDQLLTPREEQVVALVAEGMGNHEIAQELNLSAHTVKKYVFRIFEKLGISNRVELVLYAVHNSTPRPAEWLAGATRPPKSAGSPGKATTLAS